MQKQFVTTLLKIRTSFVPWLVENGNSLVDQNEEEREKVRMSCWELIDILINSVNLEQYLLNENLTLIGISDISYFNQLLNITTPADQINNNIIILVQWQMASGWPHGDREGDIYYVRHKSSCALKGWRASGGVFIIKCTGYNEKYILPLPDNDDEGNHKVGDRWMGWTSNGDMDR